MVRGILSLKGVNVLTKAQQNGIVGMGGGCLECATDAHCPGDQVCSRAKCTSSF